MPKSQLHIDDKFLQDQLKDIKSEMSWRLLALRQRLKGSADCAAMKLLYGYVGGIVL